MAKDTTPAEETTSASSGAARKGRATPTRKEREAANVRPLVGDSSKEARKAAREKMAISRDRARVGMANGEERYLPVRDKGPQRKYVRDYVDARFSLGEIMIPVMFAVIIATLIQDPVLQMTLLLGLYGFVFLVIGDAILLGILVTRKLKAKFGADKVERGVKWYAAMRSLQLRPLRLPKPQVKRFQWPS